MTCRHFVHVHKKEVSELFVLILSRWCVYTCTCNFYIPHLINTQKFVFDVPLLVFCNNISVTLLIHVPLKTTKPSTYKTSKFQGRAVLWCTMVKHDCNSCRVLAMLIEYKIGIFTVCKNPVAHDCHRLSIAQALATGSYEQEILQNRIHMGIAWASPSDDNRAQPIMLGQCYISPGYKTWMLDPPIYQA